MSEAETDLGKDSLDSTVEPEQAPISTQKKRPWIFTEKRKESLIKANKAREEKKNLSENLKLDYVEAKKEIQKAYQEASKKLVLEMSTQKKAKEEKDEAPIPIVSVLPVAEKKEIEVPKVKEEIIKVKELEEAEDKIDLKKYIKQLLKEEAKKSAYDSDTSEEAPVKKPKPKKSKPKKRPITPPPSDSEESEEELPAKKKAPPARIDPYLYQSGYLPQLMRGKRSGCVF